jgi:hypothetical protein
MAEHTRFEKLVADAKKNITEISPQDAAATIELDIEEKVPDTNAMVICHCGGGGRGALAAESLQKMGYKNVRNMTGGFKPGRPLDCRRHSNANPLPILRRPRDSTTMNEFFFLDL